MESTWQVPADQTSPVPLDSYDYTAGINTWETASVWFNTEVAELSAVTIATIRNHIRRHARPWSGFKYRVGNILGPLARLVWRRPTVAGPEGSVYR